VANQSIRSVAILGGGPAGATLGALLAKKGLKVGIFHSEKRPELIVGESLLPAVVPMLQTLGVEERVKAFSVHKPGATVCLQQQEIIPSFFRWARGRLPDYSYNTPRDLFDAAILNAAREAGATVFRLTARLQKGDAPTTVRLSDQTTRDINGFFDKGPDLIVDASGRSRLIARLLDLPADRGGRDDVALFAHLDRAVLSEPGHIHVDYLTKGWGWRIPLPGRVSVGVVVDPKHLAGYGQGIEQQYDSFLRDEPSLRGYTDGATRITPVVRYTSYQVISRRMVGPGWALIGDAAGFIDPVFSTGLYLGMRSAFDLADAIGADSPRAMQRYEHGLRREMRLWQPVIDSWYDGRLFNLSRAGQIYKDNAIGARVGKRIQKRLARVFSGQAVENSINMRIFSGLTRLGALLRDPRDLVVM
jgi:flavin-dependent dehydrogenase